MKTWISDPKFMTGRPAIVGFLALLLAGAAESSAVEGWTWPRPAAVRELVTVPASFRPYAEQVSTEVERMLAGRAGTGQGGSSPPSVPPRASRALPGSRRTSAGGGGAD
jgi:hypothetical protein